ncbi:MAG: hypothetical protein KFF72_13805 [Arthrospira sp. SH-MAG29]|nr:hypothetical protein [Arthrospira sp. SH-MAG29]MBS0017401.1 hypothetical protein [Arthrospira sp. SH-MAG29]
MSGEKRRYIQVEDRELRRLREQDSRLRSLQQDLPERLNAVQQQAQREFQQRLAPLEQRTQRQQQEISGLRTGIKDLETQTNLRLQNQRREFQQNIRESEYRQQQQLQQEVGRLESSMREGFTQQRREYLGLLNSQRQEYLNLFQQQDHKFTQLIAEERQARQQGQQILQQQINQVVENLEAESQRKQQLAVDYFADVDQVWKQIDRDYQHQRFAPGKLADLRRDLDLANSNIQGGVFEAAIATCQQTYLKLAYLRLELEQKQQEWLSYYQASLTDLRSLITEVQAHRECEVEVGQGSDAETFKCEINYWTNGRLSEYENQLNQLETQLVEGEATLTTEQVKNIGENINQLQPILGEIVEQAKLSILGSQMRAEIADRIVETLENIGYTLVDDTYEGEDERNAFVAKVKNVAGDEVVTVISPQSEFGANSVSINSFSQTLIDEKATRQNADAIFNILNEAGVEGVGEIECKQQANSQYQDMNAVKTRLKKPSVQSSQSKPSVS